MDMFSFLFCNVINVDMGKAKSTAYIFLHFFFNTLINESSCFVNRLPFPTILVLFFSFFGLITMCLLVLVLLNSVNNKDACIFAIQTRLKKKTGLLITQLLNSFFSNMEKENFLFYNYHKKQVLQSYSYSA